MCVSLQLLLSLAIVACAEPAHRPPQLPPDPNAVNGCRSSATSWGGVRYTCTTYEVIDNLTESASIRSVGAQLAADARTNGFESETRIVELAGADHALVIEYRDPTNRTYALDLIAMESVAANARFLQCHVPWFESSKSIPTRQRTCMDTVAKLLQRPPPPGREITADCRSALTHISTLQGGRPPDGSEQLRSEVLEFVARCSDKIAACALDATTYAEAMMCRD
jgi:hypothetical protein